MQEVETGKAAKSFGALIERVVRGERFVLTRYGRGVAQLIPLDPDPRLADHPPIEDLDAAPVPRPPRPVLSSVDKAKQEQKARDELLRGSRR